jgi:hypothetical protein
MSSPAPAQRSEVMSLRPERLYAEIASVARVDGVAISEAIREAIQNQVIAHSAAPDFQKRLMKRLEEDHEVLEGPREGRIKLMIRRTAARRLAAEQARRFNRK